LPEQIELNDSSGDLKSEDVTFAKYKANNNGEINIEFNEDLEALEEIEGTFTFEGKIEAKEETEEESDEKSEQEATEKERSEEHTSELQSRFDLVCRLLLEKKKTTIL